MKVRNHRDALNILESLYPLANRVRALYPGLYYDYLNSLAVELSEANRLEEALKCIYTVLKSPYSDAYPEYRETQAEVLFKSRYLPNLTPQIRHKSSVTVGSQRSSLGSNVMLLPPRTLNGDLTDYKSPFTQQARVLSFQDYRALAKAQPIVSRPIKGSGALRTSNYNVGLHQENSLWKKRKRIFDLLALPEMTEEKLDKAIEVLETAIPATNGGN